MTPKAAVNKRVCIAVMAVLLTTEYGFAQLHERAPINYGKVPAHDAVARLQARMDQGIATLKFDDGRGYLPAVLQALDIPVSSQVLVFSKTSFQLRRISPETPRAIYFGDEAYVGWVPDGDVIELSAVDPQQGAVFYTLDQRRVDRPRLVQRVGECLQCHVSALTDGVPGYLVRSVYPDRSGFPILSAGSFHTDHTSPLRQRWGGWLVSGTHGRQRHMGNVVVQDKAHPDRLDVDRGANVTDLSQQLATTPYLAPHSDIVALMVLEYQARMHNRMTSVGFDARIALHDAAVINEMMERPADYVGKSTEHRLERAGRRLLTLLLMVDEAPLTDRITGTSAFAAEYAARGPRDQHGRSLHDLDLRRRLLKYPCSPLIYSAAFDGLPEPVRQTVYQGLGEILGRPDPGGDFAHLSASDRQALREILRDTKPDLASYWKAHNL